MSNEQRTKRAQSNGDQRLVVRGKRRPEPDWDTFLSALIAHALGEADGSAADSEEADA